MGSGLKLVAPHPSLLLLNAWSAGLANFCQRVFLLVATASHLGVYNRATGGQQNVNHPHQGLKLLLMAPFNIYYVCKGTGKEHI